MSDTAFADFNAANQTVLGAANVVSAAKSDKKTRKWATKQNQLNRDFAANEAEKARIYQTEMWNKTNAYNDPSNQRKMYEKAGLSYANVVSGDSGTAASAPSAPQASSPGMTDYHARNLPVTSVSDALNQYFVNRKIALGNDLTEHFGSDLVKAQVANLLGGRYEWLEDDYRKIRSGDAVDYANLGKRSEESKVAGQEVQNALNDTQRTLVLTQVEAQKTLNKYLDAQQQAQLYVKLQELTNLQKDGLLKDQALKNQIAEQLLMEAQTNGYRISNKVAEATADSLIAAQNMSNRYKAHEAMYMNGDLFDRFRAIREGRSIDLDTKRVERALKDLDFEIQNSGTNKWIKKNVAPVMDSLGELIGSVVGVAIGSKGFGVAAKASSMYKKSKYYHPKMHKYSFE